MAGACKLSRSEREAVNLKVGSSSLSGREGSERGLGEGSGKEAGGKDARVGVTGEGLYTTAAVQGREAWPTSSSGQDVALCRDNLGSNHPLRPRPRLL